MRFVIKYEALCRLFDDTIISLGLYDSYEEANQAALFQAASKLPNEQTVKLYQINKLFINAIVLTNEPTL